MVELKDIFFAFLRRANSKKFVAWGVGTAALFAGYISSDQWMVVTSIWMSAEGILDWRRAPALTGPTQNANTQ